MPEKLGLGGTTVSEYQHGSKKVQEFLAEKDSKFENWKAPVADEIKPEAEWGFEQTMADDILRYAKKHGFKVKRLVFNEPEDLSPLVADLYRWWYMQKGIPATRLLAEMFFLIEPYWSLCTGSIPFWLAFNAASSAEAIEKYLRNKNEFDEIYLMLFNHGEKGMGLATIEQWKAVLSNAKKKSSFIGAQPDKYPFDFSIYTRYEKDLLKKFKERYNIGSKLTSEQLEQFLKKNDGRYKVELMDEL